MTKAVWRIFHMGAVLLLVSLAVTALTDLLPGSAAFAVLGETATDEQVAQFNADHGLDRPLPTRYLDWLGGVLNGDLGTSVRGAGNVTDLLAERIPVTMELAVLSILISVAVAVALALVSAERSGGLLDKGLTAISSALVSIPGFVIALILVAVLALRVEIAPATGWVPLADGIGANLEHAFLPALTLALVEVPVMYRVLRGDAVATLNEQFVLAARARGLTRRYVLFRHVLRPSSFSFVTMLGLSFGRLLGGTVIVESIFALPGVGSLAVQSIYATDIVVVQGVVVMVAVVYVAANALIDLTYRVLDPRVRRIA